MTEKSAPIKLLIAALGGEGGGVLTDWIVSAAAEAGFPVQSTSIPGVAQRTGATTYYIEIFPVPTRDLGGKRPVLALTPGVGDIDIAVASELLEAGRVVASGFVTPERTHLIGSTSRFYAMDEKIAMGDGRFDQDKLIETVTGHARETLLIDMEALARQSGSIVNAVMLGAIAGAQLLPLSAEQLEAAIRTDGKSVDGNLRGFRAGLAAARAKPPPAKAPEKKRNAPSTPDLLEHEVTYSLPALAQPTAIEGVRRLIAYQNLAYAKLYLDRLRALVEADAAAGAPGWLLKEVARQLAVRMSYEDVVRVAQAKIAPERMRRIAREELRAGNEPFSVHDFLKPGIEEMTQLLPPFLARPILALARAPRLARPRLFRHADQFDLRLRLSAVPDVGQAARFAPARLPLQAGAGANRILARFDRRGREALGRARARSRRMRPADQGLWRHACARAGQLRNHRSARDPPGACRRPSRPGAPPMPRQAPAPPLWSIRRAKAWPNAWPKSTTRRPFAWRRSSSPPLS